MSKKKPQTLDEIRADFTKTFQKIADKNGMNISFSVGKDSTPIRVFTPKKKKP